MPTFPQYMNAALVEFATFVSKSAAYTANPGEVVLVTTGTAGVTITLPLVATGGPVTVRKVDSAAGSITVKSNEGAAVTIDGISGATGVATSTSQHSGFTLASDGANWWIVGT